MSQVFLDSLDQINLIKRRAHQTYIALSLTRALAMASIVTALWLIVDPAKPLTAFCLGAVTTTLLISFTSFKRKYTIQRDDFLLSLDMNYSNSTISPFQAIDDQSASNILDWQPRLQREVKKIKAMETRRLSAMLTSLAIPVLMSILLWSKSPPSLNRVLAEAQDVMTMFSTGSTLQVLSGSMDATKNGKITALTNNAVEIVLLPQNILRLTLSAVKQSNEEAPPNIDLVPLNPTSHPRQSFQMSVNYDREGRPSGWTIDFTATTTTSLILPTVSDKPLAILNVKALPIPEVNMKLAADRQEFWPDDVPLPLAINVKAHHPLQRIQLKIRAKNRTQLENVSTIMGDATHEVATTYKLNLEPFMDEDVLDLEITAEAIDRAQPQALTGVSTPLLISAASAYGRYKTTLNTLSKVRATLDNALSENKREIDPESLKLMDQASAQAETSPFFDMLDRVELSKIADDIRALTADAHKASIAKLIETSNELANFLWEHETLDDRERDRDFFIAMRTVSRILEKSSASRPVSIDVLMDRTKRFLDQRQERWKLRVERLHEGSKPESWPKIRDTKPFHLGIAEVLKADKTNQESAAQTALVKTTNAYKAWLTELETKEDETRQKREQEQQQGLSNARNELRELQRQQDRVSNALDRAAEQNSSELNQRWQSVKVDQLNNAKQAASLLDRLRKLSPASGERLNYAIEAMEATTENGSKNEYVAAETTSDMAGRLLRDAEQSASKSQQKQDRGRRKRSSGDDYYGNAVVGGDVEIKSEYQVDPRYRENILRDVQSSGDSPNERMLLDGYLREIIR